MFSSIYRIAFEGAPPNSMIAAVACYKSDYCDLESEGDDEEEEEEVVGEEVKDELYQQSAGI